MRRKRWSPTSLILGQLGSAMFTGTVGIGLSIMSGSPIFAVTAVAIIAVDLYIKYSTISHLVAEVS